MLPSTNARARQPLTQPTVAEPHSSLPLANINDIVGGADVTLGGAAVEAVADVVDSGSTDCAVTWSACTAACEVADVRTFTTDTAQAGTGAACPAAADCATGTDACPGANCCALLPAAPAPVAAAGAGMATASLAATAIAAAVAMH